MYEVDKLIYSKHCLVIMLAKWALPSTYFIHVFSKLTLNKTSQFIKLFLTYLSLYTKMREKSAVIFLYMLLFALFSSLPSTIAVPSSSSLKSVYVENTSNQNLNHEFKKNERMNIEVADYSGTGANNHHDPKSPPGSF